MIFDDEYVYCQVDIVANNKIVLKGNVKNPPMYNKMLIIAPNPIDRMMNYSGSGLPFPCADIAFENTPNKILVDETGVFNVIFLYPNSFYLQNGRDKVISSVFFSLTHTNNHTKHLQYELPELNVLRTLVNRSTRTGPEFYGAKDYLLPIATAENVMREYARIKVENNVG
jgi:hypothetical protein